MRREIAAAKPKPGTVDSADRRVVDTIAGITLRTLHAQTFDVGVHVHTMPVLYPGGGGCFLASNTPFI